MESKACPSSSGARRRVDSCSDYAPAASIKGPPTKRRRYLAIARLLCYRCYSLHALPLQPCRQATSTSSAPASRKPSRYLTPARRHIEPCLHTDFLIESELGDQDSKSITSVNSHDDALEVVFEGGYNGHRRKASLAPNPSGKIMSRPDNERRTTACIVHSLLEKHEGLPVQDHSQSYEGLAQERRVDKDASASHVQEAQHSRLLTKKQLSDMAFGIRELSKKLSQIRLKLHVKNIFILGKAHDESLIKHSREVTDWLLTKDSGYTVYAMSLRFTDYR